MKSGVTRVGVTRAATEGVTPIFFLKNLATFLVISCDFCSFTPVYFLLKNVTTFATFLY